MSDCDGMLCLLIPDERSRPVAIDGLVRAIRVSVLGRSAYVVLLGSCHSASLSRMCRCFNGENDHDPLALRPPTDSAQMIPHCMQSYYRIRLPSDKGIHPSHHAVLALSLPISFHNEPLPPSAMPLHKCTWANQLPSLLFLLNIVLSGVVHGRGRRFDSGG